IGCDEEGNVYNVNADTAAARLAAALGAESLLSMTDIPGLLRDVAREDSLIPRVALEEIPGLIEQGVISGGMLPKVECCTQALREGVRRVFILDGRVPHSILIEVLTDAGIGTMFCQA
ncbi:MAG: acetylglutamate kinase, partial [Oscillospiraceae bacterium]|nr:acetylglutamate kinase [Oscillospiraceae bacterium]